MILFSVLAVSLENTAIVYLVVALLLPERF